MILSDSSIDPVAFNCPPCVWGGVGKTGSWSFMEERPGYLNCSLQKPRSRVLLYK